MGSLKPTPMSNQPSKEISEILIILGHSFLIDQEVSSYAIIEPSCAQGLACGTDPSYKFYKGPLLISHVSWCWLTAISKAMDVRVIL